MNGLTDLKSLERTAFRKFYEDGLFDIFLGLMLGAMALGALITNWTGSEVSGLLVMMGIAVVAVVALKVWRGRLLARRLGHFVPGSARRRRISITRLALLGSVAVGVVLFGFVAAGGGSIASLEVILPLVWFLNAVVVLGAMAHLLDVPRFFLYGFLVGLAFPLLIWPDLLWGIRVAPWIAFGAPALVVVAIGSFKLSRFLRDYPVREPSDA